MNGGQFHGGWTEVSFTVDGVSLSSVLTCTTRVIAVCVTVCVCPYSTCRQSEHRPSQQSWRRCRRRWEGSLPSADKKKQVLNTRFCRNQFELCEQNIWSINDLPQESTNIHLSVGEADIAKSHGTGQGFRQCSCRGDCTMTRCRHRENTMKCSSFCPPRNANCKMPECTDEKETGEDNDRERERQRF